MGELVLITVSGPDRQGLTAGLTEVMALHGVEILDFGQAVIHDSLAWGMLIDVPAAGASSPLFRDLLFRAHELGLNIRFRPISREEYDDWVTDKGHPRHIITLLGRRILATDMAQVSKVVTEHRLNIERIERLSGRMSIARPASERRVAIEFSVRGDTDDHDDIHEAFLRIALDTELDVAVQEDNVYRRNRRLICFDMDSTLISIEVMNEMAAAAGVGEVVSRLTEAAMRGEIDFEQSFRQRLALLEGLPVEALERIALELPITEGAERLIANVKRLGYRVAILSGGFTFFADRLRERFAIDEVHAHELSVREGKLTGSIVGDLIDGDKKASLLRDMAARERLSLEQVIAVGDGANDLPMLRIAGLGVAFHAQPMVRSQARHVIGTVGLDGILYLLGMRERDIADG